MLKDSEKREPLGRPEKKGIELQRRDLEMGMEGGVKMLSRKQGTKLPEVSSLISPFLLHRSLGGVNNRKGSTKLKMQYLRFQKNLRCSSLSL